MPANWPMITFRHGCAMTTDSGLEKRIGRLLEQVELSTGQKPATDHRRVSWRYTYSTSVTVTLVDPDTSSEPLFVTLQHISADGLDFYSSGKFRRGQKVLITVETDDDDLQIPATVVHSTASAGRPIIGVRFDLQ